MAEEKISCVKPAKGPTISESTNTVNEATNLHAAKEENKMLAKVGKPAGLSIILCKHSCFRTPAIEYIPPNDLQNRSKTGPISGPSFESGRSTFS